MILIKAEEVNRDPVTRLAKWVRVAALVDGVKVWCRAEFRYNETSKKPELIPGSKKIYNEAGALVISDNSIPPEVFPMMSRKAIGIIMENRQRPRL